MSAKMEGKPPKCDDCGKRLTSRMARVQEKLRWFCPDCYYHRTHGNVIAILSAQSRRSA